jgi:hypothetical protein
MMKRFRLPWSRDQTDTALEPTVADTTGTDIQTETAPKVSGEKNLAEKTSDQGSEENLRTVQSTERHLRQFEALHEFDPNLPQVKRDSIGGAIGTHDIEAEIALQQELENDSPYPEVRSAVRATDEDVPCGTIRSWVIGMLLMTIGAALNLLFSMRNPAIQITSIVAQLVSYPIGILWEKFMPNCKIFGLELNPGPFNMKEHALIVIMANVSFSQGAAYSTFGLETLMGFYKVDYGWGFALLFTM